ncbi:MAG: LamG domain-containing protein [Saprospiraceae bacterium]|nr:LamG domain-containing protein [Saprospiraceae bacterium]
MGRNKYVHLSNLSSNLQNGLVAYYPFCGNANDASGNGNNGTVYGATLAADRTGNINSAYFFNGTSNYIEMAATNSLQPDFLSISLWYNSASNNIFQHLLGKSNYLTAEDEMYEIRPEIGLIKRNSGCNAGSGWNSVNIQNSINSNTWYHLVMTWDGQLLKAYVNGEMVGQNNSVPPGPIDKCSVVRCMLVYGGQMILNILMVRLMISVFGTVHYLLQKFKRFIINQLHLSYGQQRYYSQYFSYSHSNHYLSCISNRWHYNLHRQCNCNGFG